MHFKILIFRVENRICKFCNSTTCHARPGGTTDSELLGTQVTQVYLEREQRGTHGKGKTVFETL